VYFDTSALVPLFVPEPASEVVASLVDLLDRRPVLSDYGAGEFASATSRLVRTGELTERDGRSILSAFDTWLGRAAEVVQIRPADLTGATTIVRRFTLKLRFPDALHISVCLERGFSLVTRDNLMAEAGETLGLAVTLFD
jgi:predicted nucleic acid-binding protein